MDSQYVIVVLTIYIIQVLSRPGNGVYWDYIIIGAGPSGLQMGYHLQKAQRQYILLEKANVSGSFYQKYPRHGKLISINKRFTGKTNHEFNLRHDWNSLLSNNRSMLFKYYSKDFFPKRNELWRYLQEYEKSHGLNIQFNTHVNNIRKTKNRKGKDSPNDKESDYVYQMEDQDGSVYSCRTLILAIGMDKPNVPVYEGLDKLSDGYESMSTDPEDFEGKSVLILGHGNAAFETADAIYGHASVVHIAGRSRVRLAWETHYVGDIRGVNNGVLDTYQLKSLDGLLEGDFHDVSFTKEGQKIKINLKSGGPDNFALRQTYDQVIRCLGFTFDDSLFNNASKPQRQQGRLDKYPLIGYDHQVTGHPGMFVIGTASHSLDHRLSSGGFIHGFRYTVRAVHHLLEYRNHKVPWPSVVLGIEDLLNYIVKRMNEASGIYQMFGMLVDVIALSSGGLKFEYFEDFPLHLIPEFTVSTGRPLSQCILLVMQYGLNYSGPGKDVFSESRATAFSHQAHLSNFLHPVFYFYNSPPTESDMSKRQRGWPLPRPKRIHHVVEDFLTTWNGPITHILPLRRFLEYTTNRDLRHFVSQDCFLYALTRKTVPLTCHNHYLQGMGLEEHFVYETHEDENTHAFDFSVS